MADESNKKAESSNASDILKSLTLGVNPEMAESAKKLVIAMKNASEEEYNDLLKMLSNSNTPDADEKPSVKDEGNVVLPGGAQLDGKQPEVFVKNEGKGEDHEESTSETLENDLNELENGENGYNSDSEKLPDNISSTSNSFTSKAPEVSSKCDEPADELLSMGENSGVDQLEVINDQYLNNETRLPELSDEAKKQADKFPSTGEKSADAQFEGTNDNSDSVSNLLKLSLEAENLPKLESTMDKCFPDSQFEATESNSFCDTEGFKLPELSLEHGRLADQLDTVGKNSYGDVHGDASSSDSEELPELLSNKAEDTCSEIEDGENNELSGTSIAQIDASRQNRPIEDLTPSMQANSRTNLLSGTTETEKDFSKRSSYELSSDDDHVTSSSSNLELTSTGSELSDEVAPSDTIHSMGLDIDGKNPDDNVTSSSVTEIRDVNTVNGDDPVQKEGRNEPAAEGVHVIERLSPIQSTGTQTSTEPEKHLHKEHLANEPICDTSGGGFDREGLDSILGFKDKGSSKLPFYYQPQIVMHEQKPVLVLQPVSLSSLLPSENNVDVSGVENDGIKARVPIILPLTSPDFDEATKDAILKKINEESDKNKIDDSLMQGYSGEVSSLSTISTCGKNSEAASSSSVRQDITKVNGKPVAGKSSKVSIEGLPEWVPSCELDRAFSAVTEQDTSSTTVETSAPLTFPTVSLPSTNPFAKDLAALHTGHGDGKVEDLSNLGLDKSLQQSLFGPPTPSSVASGARPKQMKVFPEAGHVGTATNPFTPDLTPKKRGKRQQQGVTDHSTAVVVSAEVHPSVSQSGVELNRPLPRSPRPRFSSESMVTVIETTYADTPASSAEMLSLPNDEPNKIEVVPVDHNTQLESTETLPETTKPKLRVPGKVAPFWVPDFACSNCTHCNARFTVFLRKHHCRACGKIFCKSCCSQLASFPYMDHKVGRVCPSCTEAIREVHRSKKIEKTADRQNMSQTVNVPGQGLVISGTPAQRNSQQQSRATSSTTVPLNPGLQRNQSNMPGTSQQIPIASSSGMVSLSQETQRSLPKRAVPYQPLSIPSVRAQNPALQSTGQPQGPQQPQGLQSVMQPAQPANQYMWVPASSLFVNPVAPTLQGGPVLVPAAPFTPQQAPVVLMPPSQPPSSLHLSQAATKPLNTVALGGPRGETTVANKTSSETVSTFSVLPQHVGQTATQSAQSSYAGSVEQPLLTSRQASCTVGSESSRGVLPESPSLSQSRVQATSVPGKLPSTASSSPIIAGHPSVTLQQQFSIPPVNQAGQSPQQPSDLPPSTFLPHSSPETVSPTPHQTKPASATFVSSPRRSSPSTTAVSPSQRSPPAAANSLREGTVIQAGQFRPHPTGHPSPTFLPLSSSQTVSPSPHQTKSAASATSVSSPSTTATSPTRRSPPHAAANSSREGSENQESQRPRPDDGSSLFSDETGAESKDFKPPLRRAGRTITWRYRTQGKSKLQMHKKSLAKDLRDLPDGVKIQAAADLIVHVKKMKVREKNREILVWCYQSEGLNKFRHLEVVVMLEVRKKEEIFPEEVLRVYRGILHLASKLGNSFQHGNYLSSNDQFLDSLDDAGFIFVSSEVKPKPPGLRQIQGPFLYGLLVKRLELQAAMFTPSRLLLRMGYDMKSFPFPLWNCRDRKPIYLGNENQDRFFHTVFAMNKYLKNSVPEAMVPGLCVVKEDNKVVLQIPNSGQTAVVNLLDRLIKKENQTATVPLVSDIPPYVDNCQVVICNERGGRSIQSFGNPACASVQGLGFLMLHLGVDASSPLSFGGELLDGHTQKLRQSLEEKTNCYFYLGDRFDISHFELRWVQDINYDDMPETELNGSLTNSHPAPTTSADTPAKEPGADYYPGLATIDIRYSGYGSEISLLKEVFEDHTKILHILEGNIRRACTEPLMKHESKMKAGEHLDLQLRVVLKPSYKKWSIGPNDLPTALIRSLQMALSTVKVPVVSEGELVMSFDVSVFKQ